MATEKRLIYYDVLIKHLDSCIKEGKGLFKSVCVAIKCFVEQMPTVDAYTEEQVDSIIKKADLLEIENLNLEQEVDWLKNCLNCEIRKECPRHCGKVVHGCDHWEYGDNAVEVVHGYWVSDKADILFHCSECETQISTDWDYDDLTWNYCPNCGAKMDGDGNV